MVVVVGLRLVERRKPASAVVVGAGLVIEGDESTGPNRLRFRARYGATEVYAGG